MVTRKVLKGITPSPRFPSCQTHLSPLRSPHAHSTFVFLTGSTVSARRRLSLSYYGLFTLDIQAKPPRGAVLRETGPRVSRSASNKTSCLRRLGFCMCNGRSTAKQFSPVKTTELTESEVQVHFPFYRLASSLTSRAACPLSNISCREMDTRLVF